MKQATIIKRLQARALALYNHGWDTFVECYELADWVAFTTNDDTGEPMTWREALTMAETCASVWRERAAEAARYRDEWQAAEAREPAEGPAMADDGGDWDDDGPREPLEFIPHAGDYSKFD
jgi:hypothetical protein